MRARARAGLGGRRSGLCRRIALAALGFLLALLAAPGAPAARAAEAEGEAIALDLGKGQLVRLERAAATVFIADPRIADVQVKSPRLVYLFAKAPGETSLFAVDERDAVIVSHRVVVTHNLTRLREAIAALAPGRPIAVSSVEGALVIEGAVASAAAAEELRRLAAAVVGKDQQVINRLTVEGPNQVNLRVRVAEVSREVTKEFGFNWDAVVHGGSFAIGIATGNPVVAGGAVLTRQGGANSAFGTLARGNLDLNALVDALEDQGLIKVLAEPNLTAMSGEKASFLAGGEFPILVPAGDGTLAVEYKMFGVSLAFTPTLVESGRINLRVRPEVSQLSSAGAVSFSGFSIPALTTRRAETVVELASGQSFAIAGLLQDNVTQDISKVPGLGDVPVLGALFRSDRFRRNETELVILVTPYLVRPAAPRRLAAPTDGYAAPHDSERVLLGADHRRAFPGRPAPLAGAGRLIGPAGFELP